MNDLIRPRCKRMARQFWQPKFDLDAQPYPLQAYLARATDAVSWGAACFVVAEMSDILMKGWKETSAGWERVEPVCTNIERLGPFELAILQAVEYRASKNECPLMPNGPLKRPALREHFPTLVRYFDLSSMRYAGVVRLHRRAVRDFGLAPSEVYK